MLSVAYYTHRLELRVFCLKLCLFKPAISWTAKLRLAFLSEYPTLSIFRSASSHFYFYHLILKKIANIEPRSSCFANNCSNHCWLRLFRQRFENVTNHLSYLLHARLILTTRQQDSLSKELKRKKPVDAKKFKKLRRHQNTRVLWRRTEQMYFR